MSTINLNDHLGYRVIVAERDNLRTQLSEAVVLLRRIYYDTLASTSLASDEAIGSYASDYCVKEDARAFLARIDKVQS